MIILGIHDGHNASACLIKNGEIIACIPEERLKREKNWCGFPHQAISACLEVNGIRPEEIDGVGVAGLLPPLYDMTNVVAPVGFRWLYNRAEVFLPGSILRSNAFNQLSVAVLSKFRDKESIQEKLRDLGIQSSPTFYDHHSMHAISGYGCSPFYQESDEVLVLTCDGSGDSVCGTVNIGSEKKLKRLHTIRHFDSLGELYARATQYLGMNPLSDEYKLMGLAAYANQKYGESAYQKVHKFISATDDSFAIRNNSGYSKRRYLKSFQKLFRNERFDCVAYAIQRMTEEVLTRWVVNAIRKTGIRTVVLSGGVFMNIKADGIILNHPEVERLWVLPSCSDDSLSIGAAMQASMDKGFSDIKPLKDLYLGPAYTDNDIETAILKYQGKISVQKINNIEDHIGRELADGKIIGRLAGRMEWGSRALGNRSILADPRNLKTVSRINKAIKKREFWLPYCPSILAESAADYFSTVKGYEANYMVMAFPSTERAKTDIPAAMHTYDHTIRPQIVRKDWNPGYHKVISAFKAATGVGALLNTSFNLSGYPIVCSPQDALSVFMESDLDALALENYFVTKS